MSEEVEKCPILHVRPKFDVFTLIHVGVNMLRSSLTIRIVRYPIWRL